VSNAYRICYLNLAFVRKTCRNNVLRNVSCGVCGTSVNLCRVFAAVTRISAVGIDNDLSSGKTGVAVGTAYYKTSCRIDEESCVFVEQFFGNDGAYNFSYDVASDSRKLSFGIVLRGNDNRVDS